MKWFLLLALASSACAARPNTEVAENQCYNAGLRGPQYEACRTNGIDSGKRADTRELGAALGDLGRSLERNRPVQTNCHTTNTMSGSNTNCTSY